MEEQRCVIFGIGGVLEITPATEWQSTWEKDLGLPAGAVHHRLFDVWRAGSVGTISEDEVASGHPYGASSEEAEEARTRQDVCGEAWKYDTLAYASEAIMIASDLGQQVAVILNRLRDVAASSARSH
ncbi:hypothetical protein GCM10009716_24520 [Streptomyces sodiiphilus]|uniref:Beta-ketoacyl synthase N-terminal domain-containing protein n=1 Tax=Streptomyces sodiiphilus TaxID=226217 RepID=A0ABN2P8H4_9ACTN